MKKLLLLLCVTLCVVSIAAQKTNYRTALVFAYDRSNSVVEDENIRLEIYNQQLYVTNKTTKTLFIDLAQCFNYHNGVSRPIYSSDKDSGASKAGVTKEDEFLTIAPTTGSKPNSTFVCLMTSGIYGNYTTTESPTGDMTDNDIRLLEVINDLVTESKSADPKGKKCIGTVSRHFLEDESINNIGVSIAYAFNKRSEDWHSISLSTWVSDVILTPYYVVIPKDLKKKEKRGFGVKETKPLEIHLRADSPYEFDQEKSPIIACDWEGDFKAGTFNLSYLGVLKAQKVSVLASILTYGAANLMANMEAKYYKNIVMFDGGNSDWGKMTYVKLPEQTNQTGQKSKSATQESSSWKSNM